MNSKHLMTRLNRALGLSGLELPFDVFKELDSIIHDTTLPTYSIYLPYQEERVLTLEIQYRSSLKDYVVYTLPDFSPRQLLYVMDLRNAGTSSYYPGDDSIHYNSYYGEGYTGLEELALGMANSMLNSQISTQSPSFHFRYPRTLILYGTNLLTNSYILTLAFEHTSLTTIPQSAMLSFMELAILDAKAELYPSLKRYTNIETASGTINLNIDDWADAKNERTSLLEKWDQSFHMDQSMMSSK